MLMAWMLNASRWVCNTAAHIHICCLHQSLITPQAHLLEAAASGQPLVEAFAEAFAGFSPEYVEQTKVDHGCCTVQHNKQPCYGAA